MTSRILDYTTPSSSRSTSQTISKSDMSKIPNPPGYIPPTSAKDLAKVPTLDAATVAMQARRSTDLKQRRAWDLALAPAKSLPMQGIMLYFSGSGVQIFSLGMIFMLLTSPITSILSIFKAFEPFRLTPPTGKVDSEGKEIVAPPTYAPIALQMLAYIACQGLVLALGLYKCSTMGILPTGSADWLQFETRNPPPEWSAARLAAWG